MERNDILNPVLFSDIQRRRSDLFRRLNICSMRYKANQGPFSNEAGIGMVAVALSVAVVEMPSKMPMGQIVVSSRVRARQSDLQSGRRLLLTLSRHSTGCSACARVSRIARLRLQLAD